MGYNTFWGQDVKYPIHKGHLRLSEAQMFTSQFTTVAKLQLHYRSLRTTEIEDYNSFMYFTWQGLGVLLADKQWMDMLPRKPNFYHSPSKFPGLHFLYERVEFLNSQTDKPGCRFKSHTLTFLNLLENWKEMIFQESIYKHIAYPLAFPSQIHYTLLFVPGKGSAPAVGMFFCKDNPLAPCQEFPSLLKSQLSQA